jgi:hypothetical protein
LERRPKLDKEVPMCKLWTRVAAMALLAGVAGCRGVDPPNFWRPGSAEYQQRQAERFDPYPENETGPPVVGSRPQGYEKPPAEVQRARWLPWNWGRQ